MHLCAVVENNLAMKPTWDVHTLQDSLIAASGSRAHCHFTDLLCIDETHFAPLGKHKLPSNRERILPNSRESIPMGKPLFRSSGLANPKRNQTFSVATKMVHPCPDPTSGSQAQEIASEQLDFAKPIFPGEKQSLPRTSPQKTNSKGTPEAPLAKTSPGEPQSEDAGRVVRQHWSSRC